MLTKNNKNNCKTKKSKVFLTDGTNVSSYLTYDEIKPSAFGYLIIKNVLNENIKIIIDWFNFLLSLKKIQSYDKMIEMINNERIEIYGYFSVKNQGKITNIGQEGSSIDNNFMMKFILNN